MRADESSQGSRLAITCIDCSSSEKQAGWNRTHRSTR